MKLFYKNYILKSDADRFDLYRKTPNKERVIGYSFRFEEALTRIAELETAKSDVSDLKGYLKVYKQAVKEIKEVLRWE